MDGQEESCSNFVSVFHCGHVFYKANYPLVMMNFSGFFMSCAHAFFSDRNTCFFRSPYCFFFKKMN